MRRFSVAIVVLLSLLAGMKANAQSSGAPRVLLRLDDAGLNHSVNAAIERVAATGMPVSVSVLFVGPAYREAVEMLKRHPNVAVGVHLALNSEWRTPKWGPAAGSRAVPSLVDSAGHFIASRERLLGGRLNLGEVEAEVDAQVQRAMASGLAITYVDAHMATLEATPELRAIEARVARKYGLAVSKSFGESILSLWDVPVTKKEPTLLKRLDALPPDSVTMVVLHVAETGAEMDGLYDENAPGQNAASAGVGAHRGAELDAILSTEVMRIVRSGAVSLVTYRDLVKR
jgi:chitin disaccharide deacetylase